MSSASYFVSKNTKKKLKNGKYCGLYSVFCRYFQLKRASRLLKLGLGDLDKKLCLSRKDVFVFEVPVEV